MAPLIGLKLAIAHAAKVWGFILLARDGSVFELASANFLLVARRKVTEPFVNFSFSGRGIQVDIVAH
jgi:hypothetical protein